MHCGVSTVDVYHQQADIDPFFFINTLGHGYDEFHSTVTRLLYRREFTTCTFTTTSHLVNVCYYKKQSKFCSGPLRIGLTLNLLTWTKWRAPTNVSKWRMGFNSAFKGLTTLTRLHKIAKRNYLLRHVCRSACTSVRSLGTTRLPLNGFSRNLIFEYFSKICQETSTFITIGQEYRVLYMMANMFFFIIHRSILLRMRNISDKSCR